MNPICPIDHIENIGSSETDKIFNLKHERSIVMKAVKENAWKFGKLSDKWKNDKDIVLVAVKKRGHVINFVPYELKNDKEILKEALKINRYVLQYAI